MSELRISLLELLSRCCCEVFPETDNIDHSNFLKETSCLNLIIE